MDALPFAGHRCGVAPPVSTGERLSRYHAAGFKKANGASQRSRRSSGQRPAGTGAPPALAADAQFADPVIGRIIGSNFRVLKLIGTGAMGHVYQAEQLSLGKMVALKLLRSELMGDEKLIKRFELEAKNASQLNHPNSIQIIDFGRDRDLLYIAMELLPGVDLGQLILREGPLPLGRIARIMDQVARRAGRGARPGHRPP